MPERLIRATAAMVRAGERTHAEGLLRGADSTARVVGRTTTSPGNHAGALEVRAVVDASRGAEQLVVIKPVQGGAEVAASRLAHLLGIDHLVPVAIRDGDDGARMIHAAGQSADSTGVASSEDLVQIRTRGIARLLPESSATEHARIAQREVELAQVFDYLLANSDRRARNLLVDAERGTFALIDNASIGHGTLMSTTGSAVRPRLKPFIQGEGGTTRLSPETAQWLREHLDEPTLRRWHEAHAGDIAGSADGFIARFRHVMEHSSFDFVDTSTASLNKKVF